MDLPALPPKPTEIRSQQHPPNQVQKPTGITTPSSNVHEQFKSSFLESRTASELQALLDNPDMIKQIYLAEHPQQRTHVDHLMALEAEQKKLITEDDRMRSRVVELKLEVENELIETKELEREWEDTELAMYSALKPYTSSALFSRLQAQTSEAEAITDSLLSSFLEGASKAEGEEIHDFVKEYRSARKTYHIRREHLARWRDGRVGGFR